jgi:hypothetical protein
MRLIKQFIDFNDEDVAVVVGNTYPGDMIVDGGFFCSEIFDGTTPIMDMGFVADNAGGTADPNALMSAVVPTVGALAMDELAAVTNKRCTVADQITATFSVASGTPSTGKGFAWALIMSENLLNDDS